MSEEMKTTNTDLQLTTSTTEKKEEEDAAEDIVAMEELQYDPFGKWMTLFTNKEYARQNPEISIYARCLRRMKVIRVTDDKICPAMAVTIKDGKHILIYNLKWIQKASYTEVVATLCHEAMHIFMKDIPRFFRRMALFPASERDRVHHTLNVAADAANNYLLAQKMLHMRHGNSGYWVLPETSDLLPNQDTEHYFEILWDRDSEIQKCLEALKSSGALDEMLKAAGQGGKPQSGDGNGNSQAAFNMEFLKQQNAHDWTKDDAAGEMTAEELEARASLLEGDANNSIMHAITSHQKQIGNTPQHMLSVLDEILDDSQLSWQTILKNLMRARILSVRRSSMSRPNKKRYVMFQKNEDGELERLDVPGPMYPGSKRERTFLIMYVIDTSGSMSMPDLIASLGEVQGLLKADPNAHCLVVQCDTHISNVSVLGPDENIEEYVSRVGRSSGGGTAFDQPFQLVNAIHSQQDFPPMSDMDSALKACSPYKHVDLMVYHTDGYGYAPPSNAAPPCPVIWNISVGGQVPYNHSFGQVIFRD